MSSGHDFTYLLGCVEYSAQRDEWKAVARRLALLAHWRAGAPLEGGEGEWWAIVSEHPWVAQEEVKSG